MSKVQIEPPVFLRDPNKCVMDGQQWKHRNCSVKTSNYHIQPAVAVVTVKLYAFRETCRSNL